nr:hypothetical protein L204_06501 [Cryptococcus depauperatus CBS 7855]
MSKVDQHTLNSEASKKTIRSYVSDSVWRMRQTGTFAPIDLSKITATVPSVELNGETWEVDVEYLGPYVEKEHSAPQKMSVARSEIPLERIG